MRRRAADDSERLPNEVVRFDGHPYRTAAEWQSAFDAFCAARTAWADEHGVDDPYSLPREIDGDCPFDVADI